MKSKRSFEQYRHRGIEQCILQGRYILRAKLHVATYKTIFLSIHATRAQFYLPTAIDRRKREKNTCQLFVRAWVSSHHVRFLSTRYVLYVAAIRDRSTYHIARFSYYD